MVNDLKRTHGPQEGEGDPPRARRRLEQEASETTSFNGLPEASLEFLPDEILLKIIQSIKNGNFKRHPTYCLLQTIGSVNRRLRRLCYNGMFWKGRSLLSFI
mmetsp:Transcript_25374/g.42527  ORF Transcript_25374/g.42527 Transcript_25374/m.42527 type:complete len:102 (-) Transcript_25374:1379-1684(-)